MKLFGEFLIEKGMITKDDLVKALIVQLESTPTVTEAVFKSELLSSDEFYDIFQVQFRKKTGFIEAAKELGLWNDKIQVAVEKHLAATRIPLGEILVQTGLANIESISHALDEFLADVDQDKSKEDEDEFLAELSSFQAKPVNESKVNGASSYCDHFNLDLYLELTSLLSFDQTGVFSKESVSEIINTLHTLKGISRFSNLNKSEKLITALEDKFHAVLKVGPEKMTPALLTKLEAYSKRYLDVLWSLCEDLQKNLSEDESLVSRKLEISFKQLTGQES